MLRKSKWMLLSIATVTLFSFSGTATLANMNDLKSEQKKLEQKKDSLDSQMKKKKVEISQNKSEIDKLMEKIQDLGRQIADTNGKIDGVNVEITQTTKEIKELKVSIAELEKKIAERDEILRERIRALQVSGGSVNYLDVLLGANSFSDFIDRFSAVNTLMDADRQIMEEQAADKKALEEQRKMVEDKLAQQEANKKKLVDLKSNLDTQKIQQNKLIDQLEAEQEKLQKEQASLEDEYHEAVELSKEVEDKIVSEQKRLAEIARKAEEERKRRAAEAVKKKSSRSNTNSSSSSSAPAISSGYWTKPSTGLFTSPYGNRFHPIYNEWRMHKGADLANVVGTPIYAAGAGVVSHAGRLGGFGNAIIITHSVDGQIFTTVYAHLSSVGVSQGQSVEKGQKIGGMGSTGDSTGSHLHFQLHDGYYSSSNTVNPLRYVPF
ncbi:murein hydrolase activator EnvC family protein [Saccharococcus sp. Marseille-Q5394]|uniref:murein hydrolase activator EnvC family protein n=1 Tax=Saccharococcus sp. Marseille-Q5394 TaxID=2972778 RepID=UPI0021C66CDE|nr:peptidoglycan DD-metalloendopeptidase family protein [Saccharococcus sp. Marseille-Q5394]